MASAYLEIGDLDLALETLTQAEAFVQRPPLLYIQYLCSKAKVLHLLHQPTEATFVLELIMSLKVDAQHSDDIEKIVLIEDTQKFLSETPSPISEKPSLFSGLRISKQKRSRSEQGFEHSNLSLSRLRVYQQVLDPFGSRMMPMARFVHCARDDAFSRSRYSEAFDSFHQALAISEDHESYSSKPTPWAYRKVHLKKGPSRGHPILGRP